MARSMHMVMPQPTHQEHAMFVYFFRMIIDLLDRAEHSRRDVYLASAVDIFELERRMRSIEAGD